MRLQLKCWKTEEKEEKKLVKKEEKKEGKQVKTKDEKLELIMAKIDDEVKDISKNLQLKSIEKHSLNETYMKGIEIISAESIKKQLLKNQEVNPFSITTYYHQ